MKSELQVKILIIGDIMLDHYIYGSCNRISPEAPVPVVEVDKEEHTLGGAGNVVKNLVALNCQTNIVSIVGDDSDAEIIFNQLALNTIPTSGIVKDNARCTTVKTRVISLNHQMIRLDRENTRSIEMHKEEEVLILFEKAVQQCDLVLISDYNKGLLSRSLLGNIFDMCRKKGVKTIVDPKGLDFSKYKGVNVIKPNKKEAIQATGIQITDDLSLAAACKKIKEITLCDDVVITMSENGIAFYSNNELNTIPTKAQDVIDVTGAGDTVLASLGLSLAQGNSLKVACEFANHAAAVVVNKVGSATASLNEIMEKFVIS